jgi:heat-inducible transcriptional repressor
LLVTTELSHRERRILALLVREYIETGAPVSSRHLADTGSLGLSSATVRNVLATLEDGGYVHQPHTSAGRVATDSGYRCYVDMLLQNRRSIKPARVKAQLFEGSIDAVLSNVSHELSRVCHHVGFALAPRSNTAILHRIEFVPITAARILVVLVDRSGQVSHKVIELDKPIGPSDLQQATNYLNTEFSGLPLSKVRIAVIERLQEERLLYDALLARTLRLADTTLKDFPFKNNIFIQGTSSLLDEAERTENRISLATLRALLKMIEEKHRLIRLLNHYVDEPGLMVIIGGEHVAPDLRSFSLVASTYSKGNQAGTVGVIGPTRMRYSRAISIVNGIADSLSRTLSHTIEDEYN